MYHLVTSLVEDDEVQSETQTLQTLGYHWEDSSQKYIHIFKKKSLLKNLVNAFSSPLSPHFWPIFVNNTENDVGVYWNLTDPIFVKKQRHEPFAGFLLTVGVNSHEPICGSVLGSGAEMK